MGIAERLVETRGKIEMKLLKMLLIGLFIVSLTSCKNNYAEIEEPEEKVDLSGAWTYSEKIKGCESKGFIIMYKSVGLDAVLTKGQIKGDELGAELDCKFIHHRKDWMKVKMIIPVAAILTREEYRFLFQAIAVTINDESFELVDFNKNRIKIKAKATTKNSRTVLIDYIFTRISVKN